MSVVSLMPSVFQRIRLELIEASRHNDWEKVRVLDKRMGKLIDEGLQSPDADKLALSRELSMNMRVYKSILRKTSELGAVPER